MTLDLQELVALLIVVAVVALNLWLRRRWRRANPGAAGAAADCAGCPKSAAEPAATKPRLVQLGGNAPARARD